MDSSQEPEGESSARHDGIEFAPEEIKSVPDMTTSKSRWDNQMSRFHSEVSLGQSTVPVSAHNQDFKLGEEVATAKCESETSVSALVVPCLRNLNRVVSADLTSFESEVAPALWKDEMGRLRVWAANIGAHQQGHSSLDHRLRDSSHIREQTVRVLGRLQRIIGDIDDALNHKVEHDDFFDSDISDQSDDEENLTEVQSIYQALCDTINNLFQLSMIIRQPAQHDRLLGTKRSDASFYEHFDRQHVMGKYPKVEEEILNRLGLAISQRRAVLRYRERHRMKLGQGLNSAIEDEEEGKSAKLSDTVATTFIEALPATKDEWESQTVASKTSYAATLMNGAEGATLPSPPKDSINGTPVECPYCFTIITIPNRSAWARHIFNDLMPYLCIFPNCSTPHRLYESRREWFAHLQDRHSVQNSPDTSIECPLCLDSIPGGKQLERHVGRHLEELALFALPRSGQDDEDPIASDEEQGDSKDSSKDAISDKQLSMNKSESGGEDTMAGRADDQDIENPQEGNSIASHIVQRLQSQGPFSGWQGEVDIKTRARVVWNRVNSLLPIHPYVNIHAAVAEALEFELETFTNSSGKAEYELKCQREFDRVKEAREAQAATLGVLHDVPQESSTQQGTQDSTDATIGGPQRAIRDRTRRSVNPDNTEEVEHRDEGVNEMSESANTHNTVSGTETGHGPDLYHSDDALPHKPLLDPEASDSPDILYMRNRGSTYPLSFRNSVIDDSILTVGMLRSATARQLNVSSPDHVRLLFKGRLLKDDNMPCKAERIKNRSELLCVISEVPQSPSRDSSGSEPEPELSDNHPGSLPSKSRVRGGSTRTPRNNSPVRETSHPDVSQPPLEFFSDDSDFSETDYSIRSRHGDSTHIRRRTTSRHVRKPQMKETLEEINFKLLSPMEKVDWITREFDTNIVPLCNEFVRAPPVDEQKRGNEHTALCVQLNEKVIRRVDKLDTKGDSNAWSAAQNLIRRTQSILQDLNQAAGL